MLGTAWPLAAQSLAASGSTVASFAAGIEPVSSLVQASDGNLYGVTNAGGAYGCGSIYQLTLSGTMSTLYSFTGDADGGYPAAGLVEAPDGALYGTTTLGGANGFGTVFRLGSAGFATLHSFDPNVDGNSPYSALTLASDGNLYGVLAQGAYDSVTGDYASGTIFQVTTAGEYQNVYSFPEDQSLGDLPIGRLVQASDGNLWGTTSAGGANGYGTVFFWNPTSGLSMAYAFTGADGVSLYGLTQSGSSLYGVTYPELSGCGEVFAVSLSSHTFSLVYSFAGGGDGGSPASSLLAYSDGYLYGTTQAGGNSGTGTLFRLNGSGTPVTLYSFPSGTLNTFSDASLVEASTGALYLPLLFDTTVGLGPSQMDGAGNVSSLQPNASPKAPPPVELTASAATVALGQSVTLNWTLPNASSLTAQQCTAFSTPATSWSGHKSSGGSFSLTLTTAGSYAFSLSCGGNQAATVTVIADDIAVTTLTAPASVTVGQTATLRASISSSGGSSPGGSVRFVVNGFDTLASVNLSAGSASFTASTQGVAAGTYAVQAIYSGDASHAASSSSVAHVQVLAAATTTTIAASSVSVNRGQAVTLTASVASSGGTPTGSVTFLCGSVVVGSATLHAGTASFTASTSSVAPGTYPVHAAYSGSPSFQASSSANVSISVH